MSQLPPTRRANRQTEQPAPPPVRRPAAGKKRKKKKSRAGITIALIAFLAVIALIVLIAPKEHLGRATYTTGTESGLVDSSVASDDAYYSGLVISEIMPSNSISVPDENGNYPDWVEIWNNSGHDIEMENVGLSDSSDAIRFLFPKYTLAADARVVVFCDDTNQVESNKPFHAKFKLSSTGETLYLYQPSAYLIDSVTYRIMGSDTSWALQEDGSYAEVSAYSPGYVNSEEGFQSYRTATMITDGALIINEISPDPKSGLADADGEYVDWIELYNTTDKTISLDNYALSDKENKPLKWRFPEGATIAPKSYYVVFCSGKDRVDESTGIPHTNFKLSAEHDTIVLSDSRGRLVDRVIIDNIPEDCTYARGSDGYFTITTMGTPSLANTEESAWQMDRMMRQWNASGVIISEVMASNSTTAIPNTSLTCDWIEIYNTSNETVDLSGYGLSDNIGRPRRWQFPEGTVIYPGEYKVILCDGDVSASTSSVLHTNFKITRAGGETICLSDPTGKVLDKLVLSDEIPTDVSYGRTLNLTGFFYYGTPTPNSANNNDGFRGYCPQPTLSLDPGLHYSTVYVSLSIPENCVVTFTTDGSIPTRSSTAYNGELLEINFTTVLRARAFRDDGQDYQPSRVTTGTYFINAYHALPVVSLVADPKELWSETDGMLTVGSSVDKSVFPFKNTIYSQFGKIEREGHVEYYLLDGTQVLDQDMEFGLQGQYSLDMPQKTFKLRARSKYGSKYFNAKLFNDREYTQYRSFVLRNSGNDCAWTRLLDGFESRLLDAYGSTVLHQAWNPVVVYLNGTYWGHYNMRERVDQYFVAQHEGLSLEDADKITILEANGTLAKGSNTVRKEYQAMIKKIKDSDPAKNEEDLQYILDNVDVDNYLEYMALLMFVGDSDPGNIRYYRIDYEDGTHSKWRWIWYDKDYGLYNSSFNSPKSYTKSTGMGQKNINNTLLLKLLEVPEYKDQFLRKLGDIFQTFTTDYMLEVLQPLIDQIEPEMNMHFNRWAEEHDQAIVSEWPTTPDGAYRYWQQRIDRLKNTLKKRPNLLWGYIKDELNLTNTQMLEYFGERPAMPEDAI